MSNDSKARQPEWWNRSFVAAAYQTEGKNYPQMQDDSTPSMTTGQAMSGHAARTG